MSDRLRRARRATRRARRRDEGFTLIEMLISISLIGTLTAVISMATVVVLRTRASTTGRANNARSEQVIGVWMPGDLASAETVDTSPGAVPCGPTPACPPSAVIGGSNAVMLTWTSSTLDGAGNAITTKTVVSYRVVQVGIEYQMVRVQCEYVGAAAPTCSSVAVLHDLDPPPPGFNYVPGRDTPSWIITVSNALPPDDTQGPQATVPTADPGLRDKNGQRVVVTINGGGVLAEGGGGQKQITLSAGGTNREDELSTSDLTGAPTFTAARSRCGGNFALLVDTSGSIGGTNMGTVRTGIVNFIDTFAGTPIKLEVIRFSDTAGALGTGAGEWVHYFDMLNETDIATLKSLVGGLTSSGSTNWEDGVFRTLKNSDGTVQSNVPNTVLFFTDGVPTRSRLEGSSASAPAVADPADGGLPASDGSSLYQKGWNRAERLIRDRGKVTMIGVFVGSETATNTWRTAGAGYHWLYEMGDTVAFQRGSHPLYQIGNALTFDRGYHVIYEVGNALTYERGFRSTTFKYGNKLTFEKGYHLVPERNSAVTFQIAQSGVTYEAQQSNGQWSSNTGKGGGYSNYIANNTTNDESDGYRMRVTGSLGNWTSMTVARYNASNTAPGQTDGVRANAATTGTWSTITDDEYDLSNTSADSTDGYRLITKSYTAPYDLWETSDAASFFAGNANNTTSDGWRATVTGTSTTWTTVSGGKAMFDKANSTYDDTDGFQQDILYSAPYDYWQASTQAAFLAGNTTNTSSDGWRSTVTGTSSTWTPVGSAQYGAANSTTDSTDGWRTTNDYTAPYDLWEPTTQATFLANNANSSAADGWRSTATGASSSWTTITSTQYANANATADESDGFRAPTSYTSPFSNWEAITQAQYDAGNTVSGSSDGYQAVVSGTPVAWAEITSSAYTKSNTTSDASDGFRATKVYAQPYTAYEGVTTKTIKDYATLGNIVVDNTSGDEGGFVKGVLAADGKTYTNAAVADLFVLKDYTAFNETLKTVALGQCGGTVTMQTRVGSSPAQDPFTYQLTPSNQIVQTSAAFRSGTFDVALPGGSSTTVTIAPQEFTDLVRYQPAGWSCKSGGVPYPFTTAPIAGHAPWTSITMTVNPNQAVSCIQQVTFS